MKSFLILFCVFGYQTFSWAQEVAVCHGSLVLDDSPVTAKVSLENGVGKIVIQTTIDTVMSQTKIESIGSNTLSVYDNDFKMNFTLSSNDLASPVEAFRGGAFFVEDFICSRSK